MRFRGTRLLTAVAIAAITTGLAPVAGVGPAATVLAASPFTDPHFREVDAFTGLTLPIQIRFAADGRAFVAEKRGVVKAYDSMTDTTPTTVIDLRGVVDDFWDRGLLGMILDPSFLAGGAAARPYLYLDYVYDAPPGGSAPVWNDACPTPPGPNDNGCVVTSKLVRYTIDRSTNVVVPGSAVELIHDWCSQFPSHSGGAMTFGNDGYLYVTGGDGASFTVADYGQKGGTLPNPANPITPINPCSDPVTITSPPGQTPVVDVATSEGGSLRSQDLRTPGDPVTLDGTLIRVNPDSGLAAPGNPLAGSADLNARRIVAYGFRNPFRLTKNPDSGDIYIGDVGNVRWEEVNRFVPGSGAVKNFGWPCYEGAFVATPWDTMGNDLCDNLVQDVNAGNASVVDPMYAYWHAGTNHPCGVSGGSNASISGLSFYDAGAASGTTAYPSRYDGALFFVDYSRNCLTMLRPGAGGVPNPNTWEVIANGIGHPVDLTTGPHGDLYYVDHDGGRVVRIRYAASPVARATATPAIGRAPITVTLNGSTSTDPDPDAQLTAWQWDLDNDGVFNGPNDASGQVVQWDIDTPAIYPVTLRVTSSNGLSDDVDLTVNAANNAPVPHIATPTSSLHWSVGDTISFSGSATDTEDGQLPASALTWTAVLFHCVGATCHEHTLQTFTGVASGSFTAPDHPYPSHLELRLAATDSAGSSATTAVELDPATTTLGVASVPTGVAIDIGGETETSPSTTTLIRGGSTSITAPAVWTAGPTRYRFTAWDDGLGRSHDVTITNPVTRTATYVTDAPDDCSTARAITPGGWVSERASGNGDVDWFRFTVTGATRRVVVTLGDLPVNATLELYAGCTSQLLASDQPGTRFERLTRNLAPGTYRVRVRVPSGAASLSPFALRVLVLQHKVGLESLAIRSSAGTVRVAGQLVNGTGGTLGPVAVTATFRDAQGRVVGRLIGTSFANRLAAGAVTPFALSGSVPAYVTVSYGLAPGKAGPVRALSLRSLQLTPHANGTVTEAGKVRNDGATRATSVAAARAWYGRRGEILDVRSVSTTPSALGPRAIGSFTILRPSLGAVQATATFLRGR